MLISLPIKKSKIVLSKYLSIFVYISYVLLLNLIIYLVFYITKLPIDTVPFSIELLLGAIIVPVLYCSISFPLIFKLGYLKARMVNFVLFFAIVFGGTWFYEEVFAGQFGNFLTHRSRLVVVCLPLSLLLTSLVSKTFRPRSRLISVDFPTPDEPMNATVCPFERYLFND